MYAHSVKAGEYFYENVQVEDFNYLKVLRKMTLFTAMFLPF